MATKNDIYLEWDILYDGIKTKKQRNKVLAELLKGIESRIKPGSESIPLMYEVFKSETNKHLYVLRVYKRDYELTSAKTSGPIKSKSMMTSVVTTDSLQPLELFSGPTRPSGPPSQIPPG